MIKDFQNFILRGNVVDLAVAVIIGASFKKIVDSFVADIIMPPIGVAMGGVNFSDLKYIIQEAAGEVSAVTINYGSFIQTLVDFVIVGLAIFVAVKMYEKMQKKQEEEPAGSSAEEALLTEIRDLMKKKK